MLREATLEEVEAYLPFAYELSQDLSTSFFPTYLDGIKTKADFYNTAHKSFSDPNCKILLFLYDNQILGWIDYYFIPEDLYLSFHVFNVIKGYEQAIEEFIIYAKENYSGYTLYFGLPSKNISSIDYLKYIEACKLEESFVYTLNFDNYTPMDYAGKIVRVNGENWIDFKELHEKVEGMYWNSERLLKALNNPAKNTWNIYLLYENGRAIASIYYIYTPILVEIFGIDYIDGKFDKKVMRNLLVKALNQSKLDMQKHMVFFVGDEEKDVLDDIGFDYLDRYELYVINL